MKSLDFLKGHHWTWTPFIERFYYRFVICKKSSVFLNSKPACIKSWSGLRFNLVPSPTEYCYWKWYHMAAEWCLRSCPCLKRYSPFRIIDNYSVIFPAEVETMFSEIQHTLLVYWQNLPIGKTSPNNAPFCIWGTYRELSSIPCVICYITFL